MDFGFYYRPDVNRVLFHFVPDTRRRRPCCYDTVVSESRIVDYIGIGRGQLPQKAYYGRWRTFPDTCDYSFQETKPVGADAQYFGVDVFEGAYRYDGTQLVPSLGRQHVRGADAGAVRARGAVGAAQLGRQPPAHRAGADPPRPAARPATATGASRPRTSPRAATSVWGVDGAGMDPNGDALQRGQARSSTTASRAARTARRSPTRRRRRTRTASSPRTPRSSRCATRRGAARRQPAPAGARLPRASTAKWGFRDSVNVETGACLEGLPVARPGDDHGRARQRARRRRAARARSPTATSSAGCGR